jgi:sugar O-acyltransferase (sialic acid O-acetyltransferase NeuD family)
MEKIIIFGTGLIADLAEFYLHKDYNMETAAFTVDSKYIKENLQNNKPVVAFENIEKEFSPDKFRMFVALSYNSVNKLREEKYLESKRKGYKLVSYVSPLAVVFDNVEIGENCFILENNVIQPFVKIGNNNTLWSGNHIGHHSIIEDNCFLSSHVVVSGGVKIESNCFIGVNSAIRDNVIISKGTVIGAGSLIMKNTKENEVYISERTVPSKLKSNELRKI